MVAMATASWTTSPVSTLVAPPFTLIVLLNVSESPLERAYSGIKYWPCAAISAREDTSVTAVPPFGAPMVRAKAAGWGVPVGGRGNGVVGMLTGVGVGVEVGGIPPVGDHVPSG